nr:MAG TPA: hypothetical protein [Caudoviricetes sp.]
MNNELDIDLIKKENNFAIQINDYNINLLPSVSEDEALLLFCNLGLSIRQIFEKSSANFYHYIEK